LRSYNRISSHWAEKYITQKP